MEHTDSFMSGSSMHIISLQTLLWSRSNRNSESKCVCNIQSIIYEKHQESFFGFQLEGSASTNTSLSLAFGKTLSLVFAVP